jgi:hypothetical protein
MQIQSHIYAKEVVHPFFVSLCEIINKHEKSIVNRSIEKLELDENLNFLYLVNIYVFEAMIPNVIKHIRYCHKVNALEELAYIHEFRASVNLSDAIFHIWMSELPNKIWLPLYADHEVILKYQNSFNSLQIKYCTI